MATYYPIVNGYYNPVGIAPPTVTSVVTYNGTPTTTGGTTDYPVNNLTANEILSTILLNFYNEYHRAYLRMTVDEALIAEIEVDLAEILAAIAALKTSGITYDGTTLDQLGLSSGNHPENDVWTALNAALLVINNDIAGISTGVSLSLLDTTLATFVTSFVSGITYSGHTLLSATFASGYAIINGQYTTYAGGNISVSASQDNYIYLNRSNALVYLHVNNGAGPPATPANTVLLQKLVTDGTTITGNTDLRNLTPFTVSQLSDLYANNSIPFAARKTSEWVKYLLGATTTTGKTIVSNGSQYEEADELTLDRTSNRLGINQSSPLTTLDLTSGTIRLGDDGTNLANSIKAATGRLWFRNASAFVALASALTELSDLTITSQAANDVIYANSTTTWANKPNGTVPIKKTAATAALVIVAVTDVYIYVDVTANAVTVQLPDATTAPVRPYYIMHTLGDITSHSLTISATAGLIKGAPTLVLTTLAKNAVICIPDGTNWGCIAG